MANELYIPLNKKNFEGLMSGETNEISIKKSDWWAKRLIDQDTGVFKKFDVAGVTSGGTEKKYFDIEKIELRGNKFIITVKIDEKVVENDETGTVETEIIEPVTVNPVVVNEDGNTTQKSHHILSEEDKRSIIEKFAEKVRQLNIEKEEEQDIKPVLAKLLDSFCSRPDVFIVNMPNVTIRNNGRILGCNKKIIADRESDVMFKFEKIEMIQYPGVTDEEFIEWVKKQLDILSKNNYVFINKKMCGFSGTTTGDLVFTIRAVGKKKYLFRR